MKLSQVVTAVNTCLDCHLPAMLWGPAGVGKSDSIFQVGEQRKIEVRDVRLANLDPTDIKGFPVPDAKKGVMTWLPAEFMPKAGEGILFFDELNLADKMTQASCYQLMLTRQVGNYTLPPGWNIIAAGNTEKDRANVTRMAGPLANRMIHLDVEADVDEWTAYARAKGVSDTLIAFIRFRRNLLHSFDPQSKDPAFPSPRTWFFMDALLKRSNVPMSVRNELMIGTVGSGAATELQAFLDHMADLPTIEEVLADPQRAPLPSKISARWAITTMLGGQSTAKNFPKCLAYINRFQSQELSVVYARDAAVADPTIKTTPTYRDWALANADVVL